MNLTSSSPTQISIALSRRNLRTLLKMLDTGVGMPVLHRTVGDGVVLFVKAEEDQEHYTSPDRQEGLRGVMGVGPEDV